MSIIFRGCGGGASEAPSIEVSSSGLITATSGNKSSTYQMNTRSSATITPGTSSQTAVSSGCYTTGSVIVAGDYDLVPSNIKSGVNIFGVTGSYEGQKTVVLDGGSVNVDGAVVTITIPDDMTALHNFTLYNLTSDGDLSTVVEYNPNSGEFNMLVGMVDTFGMLTGDGTYGSSMLTITFNTGGNTYKYIDFSGTVVLIITYS